MESIQFVWSYDDKQIHILWNDEDNTGLTLCGNGHGRDMDDRAAGTQIPDSDMMCLQCLHGASLLADNWSRRYRRK